MTAKEQTIDYTKMELGRVTRTYKGRNVCIIGRCPKCGKKGERSTSIPGPDDARRGVRPYVSVHHVMVVKSWGDKRVAGFFGQNFGHVTESCSMRIDKTNVDDLLGAEERRRYDAFVAGLRTYVDQF